MIYRDWGQKRGRVWVVKLGSVESPPVFRPYYNRRYAKWVVKGWKRNGYSATYLGRP